MRTIIFLVALLFVSASCQMVGGYTKQDPKEVQNDVYLESLLKAGQKQFIQEAATAGDLASTDLTLEKVLSTYTQVVAGTNARFNVEFSDAEGNPVYVTLTVYGPLGKNAVPELTSYTINDAPTN